MKQLYTEIEINASPQHIWDILTNFDDYEHWNPFIKYVKGQKKVGAPWKVLLHAPGMKPMEMQPVCASFDEPNKFSWKGKLLFKGLFDGEHIFELHEVNNEITRFVHRENFTGILVPLIWNKIELATQNGFTAMNNTLKEQCEETE